ncbi:MAG TPA: DUF1801 domain-containing protein [Burkholderiaceae bacterium]|nr:DUF1801 domain-containing protein [Burkholderiaceae bacterium]
MPSRSPKPAAPPPAALIDERIATLGDWRGAMLARLRALILEAGPDIAEDWKWSGPCWTHAGLICTGETYQRHVKLTFAHGAALPDPGGLFNSSLDGRVRRAIDFAQGAEVDGPALQALVRAAAAYNAGKT